MLVCKTLNLLTWISPCFFPTLKTLSASWETFLWETSLETILIKFIFLSLKGFPKFSEDPISNLWCKTMLPVPLYIVIDICTTFLSFLKKMFQIFPILARHLDNQESLWFHCQSSWLFYFAHTHDQCQFLKNFI